MNFPISSRKYVRSNKRVQGGCIYGRALLRDAFTTSGAQVLENRRSMLTPGFSRFTMTREFLESLIISKPSNLLGKIALIPLK